MLKKLRKFGSADFLFLTKEDVGRKGDKVKIIEDSSRMVIIDQKLGVDTKRTYIGCKTGDWGKNRSGVPINFNGNTCKMMACYLQEGSKKGASCNKPSAHGQLSITGFSPGWKTSLEHMSEFDRRKILVDLIIR